MNYFIKTLTLLGVIFLMGCGGSESPSTSTEEATTSTTTAAADYDYDGMAEALCNCMTPMMELQDKLMKLMQEGNQDGIMAMQDEALKVQQDGEACVEAMEAKYGTLEGVEEEEKATEALRKFCPDFVAMMEAAEQPPTMAPPQGEGGQ